MTRRISVLLAAVLLSGASASAGELRIGDPAPALRVERWLKGEPVTKFEPGHVYVVELWATWCAPCRRSIPHLSALQKAYGKDVTFIGVSVRERDFADVEPFVQQMGERMAYTVATDLVPEGRPAREGAMSQGWMEAAGRSTIPVAFVVDGRGRIAWIGHPLQLADPLARVMAGTWKDGADRAGYEKGRKKLYEALDKQDWKTVVDLVDRLLAAYPGAEVELGPQKFKALLQLNAFDDAYAYARGFVDGPAKDAARALNFVAWTIVDPEMRVPKRDLELALRAAQRANDLTEHGRPEMLDTLALVCFELGEREKAIEIQERAVELAVGTMFEAELRTRLEQYKKAVERGAPLALVF